MKKIRFIRRKPRRTITENTQARIAANQLRARLSVDVPTLERLRQAQRAD